MLFFLKQLVMDIKAKRSRTMGGGNNNTMKKSFYIIWILFFTGLMFLFSSCQTIPPGIAPKGDIVEISSYDETPLSTDNAVNNMFTALSTSEALSSGESIPVIPPITTAYTSEKTNYSMTNLSIRLMRMLAISEIVKVSIDNNYDCKISSYFTPAPDSLKFPNMNIYTWTITVNKKNEIEPSWKYSIKVLIPKDKQ